MDVKLGQILVGRFSDGEVQIQVQESVRGKDIYIIQVQKRILLKKKKIYNKIKNIEILFISKKPTCTPVNENLVELLLMVASLRRSSARRITVVVPYYGYSR